MYRWVGTLVFLFAGIALSQETGDSKSLEGKWLPVSAEVGGAKLQQGQLSAISLTLKGDTYTVMSGDKIDKGTFKLDPSAKPKAIDIVGVEGPNKGKTLLAIYDLQKDILRVCYDVGGKKRPTEFVTSKEKPFLLIEYRRAKP